MAILVRPLCIRRASTSSAALGFSILRRCSSTWGHHSPSKGFVFATRADHPGHKIRQFRLSINDGREESKNEKGNLIWTLVHDEKDNLSPVVELDSCRRQPENYKLVRGAGRPASRTSPNDRIPYNDGGDRGFVGFGGTCSNGNIIRNVKAGRIWCALRILTNVAGESHST